MSSSINGVAHLCIFAAHFQSEGRSVGIQTKVCGCLTVHSRVMEKAFFASTVALISVLSDNQERKIGSRSLHTLFDGDYIGVVDPVHPAIARHTQTTFSGS